MKKGFTLIEVLVTLAIISIISVSAVIAFNNIDNDTSIKSLEDKYVDIQRAGKLYLDLNDAWLEQFVEKREIYIKISELKNAGYITGKLINPLNNEEIPEEYLVKIFITGSANVENVNSCIVNISNSSTTCISNSMGKSNCNYNNECK